MKRLIEIITLLAAMVIPIQFIMAAVVYVSPVGDDGHPGDAPERALRTIQAAVNRLQPGDTCKVLAGVYRETVVFPKSGAPDKPITLKAYKDDRVTVSGLEPVDGWTRHEGGIWKAPMDWTLGTGRNQVFLNGRVLIEARHPNQPAEGLGMYVSDLSPLWPTFGEFSIPEPLKHPHRIVGNLLNGQPDDYWKGAIYYGVHYQGWAAQTAVVESSRSGEINVGDCTRGWWFGPAYGGGYKPEDGRGMLVGHMNALDRPGEWHWQDNTLYLIPPKGSPENIEAKKRQLAFDLSGREFIHIEGLRVKGASMRLNKSAHCVVNRCDFSYISHYTRHYGVGVIEHGRETVRSGETGIYVGGHDNAFLNCSIQYSAGTGFHVRGYHHTIHNCLIDEVSYTSHYLNAITDAVGDFPAYENQLIGGHVITFNTMRNAGRHFFNFNGNGTSKSSRDRAPMDYMATLFAHNHLYNGMLQTKDAGFLTGYYTSGGTLNGLNSRVVYNCMHDSYDTAAMRWNSLGIVYLDAGTCNVSLHHNLLWAAPGSLQRGLWYNTMCVGVREHDNVFHKEFKRTSAELVPADFPEGKPFRFGHDFDNPPPVPQWPPVERKRIRASEATSRSDGVIALGDALDGFKDGDWFAFDNVDFAQDWQSAVMHLASDTRGMNVNKSARSEPRHKKATDPLVFEATIYDGAHKSIEKHWSYIHGTVDSSWLCYKGVPLGNGYRRFRAVYGNALPKPRCIEVHLDGADGPVVARIPLKTTDRDRGGSVQIYGEATGEVSAEAKGTRDVYLVFRSEDDKPAGNFEYFRFEQYCGQIVLQKTEVKIEMRVDGVDGEKIGEFYPRHTNGKDEFRNFVAKLEPVGGKRAVYFVVRSALDKPIGLIDWISLEKAKDKTEIAGIGAPPLRDAQGKLVFPAPTNRPCARPADMYAAGARRRGGKPLPFHPALRLSKPPVIDGKLDEWEGREGAMILKESWDGKPSAGAPSTAWIAYDDSALYVACRHPVKNAAGLVCENHTWGKTDAMEIAFCRMDKSSATPVYNLYGWPDGQFRSVDTAGAPLKLVERLGKAATYKAAVGPDAWTCEWRIPFEVCGFTPAEAPMLLFNMGVRKLASKAWVIWKGTYRATYAVGDAGAIVFPGEFMAGGYPSKEKLALWLDASDADSVETDADGKVVRWLDRSGRNRHARQDAKEYRPAYAPNGLNDMPSLRFSGEAKTRLDAPDLSDKKTSATIVVVFSNPNPGARQQRIFAASDGKEYDYKCGMYAIVPENETGGPRMDMFAYRNRWAKSVRVGCFSPAYQTFLTGHVAEILVYERMLSADEKDAIRAYLTIKWKLY